MALAGCGNDPESQLRQGRVFLDQSEYPAAIISLKNVLEDQPGNGEARLLLGRAHLAMQAFQEAEKELLEARKLKLADDLVLPPLVKALLQQGKFRQVVELKFPESGLGTTTMVVLHSARGLAFHALGDPSAARVALTIAQAVDASHPELFLARSSIALFRGDHQEAGRFIDQALKRDPGYIDGLYMKAILRRTSGQDKEALELYQRIVELDPRQFIALVAMATIKHQLGDQAGADQALQAAEKFAANVPLVLYTRGSVELARGNLKAANAASSLVMRQMPDYPPNQLLQAKISLVLGDYEQSRKLASAFLLSNPGHLEAGRILAATQIQTKETYEALSTLRGLAKKHGGDARLLALMGEAHLAQGEYGQAMDYLRQAAAIDPVNPAVKILKAKGHQALGQTQQAYAEMQSAARLNRGDGTTDLEIVSLYLQNRDWDRALGVLRELEQRLPDNPALHNLRAHAFLGRNEPAAARTSLEKALTLNARFIPANLNLARLDMLENRLEDAQKRLRGILSYSHNQQEAMLGLAEIAKRQNNESAFLEWLDLALKSNPRALNTRSRLVRHHLDKKESATALRLAKEGYGWDPKNPGALLLQGETQLEIGHGRGAEETFMLLVNLAPSLPEAHLGLARAQMAMNTPTVARASLERALSLRPDFTSAQRALALLDLAQGKRDQALAMARRIQSQRPASPAGFRLEGEILNAGKRPAEAAVAFQKALDRAGSAELFILTHRALVNAGDMQKAEYQLKAWLARHDEDMLALLGAAETYMLSGHDRDAIILFEKVVQARPDQAAALNNLANLYHQKGDPRAVDMAERALKAAPGNPYLQDTLGWILLEQGQLPRALETLRRASEAAPQSGTLRYHFGFALMRAGNREAARKELQAAVARGDTFPEYAEARGLLKGL